MPEGTPQLPVSEQETQIQAPSLLEKIQAQKKKILIGLGSFLGVLIMVGAAFGAYKFGQRQVLPPLKPTPTPIVEATPTPDPTADWETYTNNEYGYSIKYPKEARFFEGPTRQGWIHEAGLTYFGPSQKDEKVTVELLDGFGLTISVAGNPSNKTSSEFAEETYEKYREDIQGGIIEGDISKCKIEDVTRGGVNGKRLINCFVAPGVGVFSFSEWYAVDQYIIQIAASLANEANRQIFNFTLSTFKFLEEESCGEMTLTEAKEIALASECVKEGSLKETYSCNEYTDTWWLDLDIEKPGCAPACVVNVVTKEAEINWRCTGLIPE